MGRPRIPASWEWRKVGPGHYLVEGFVIRRARRGCWETTHVSGTVGLAGTLTGRARWHQRLAGEEMIGCPLPVNGWSRVFSFPCG